MFALHEALIISTPCLRVVERAGRFNFWLSFSASLLRTLFFAVIYIFYHYDLPFYATNRCSSCISIRVVGSSVISFLVFVHIVCSLYALYLVSILYTIRVRFTSIHNIAITYSPSIVSVAIPILWS